MKNPSSMWNDMDILNKYKHSDINEVPDKDEECILSDHNKPSKCGESQKSRCLYIRK